MFVESACFDPNTIQQGLSEEGFSHSNIIPNNCNPNFAIGEDHLIPYHQNPSHDEASAMQIELQHCYDLSNTNHHNYDPSNDTHWVQEIGTNNNDPSHNTLPYDQMSYHNISTSSTQLNTNIPQINLANNNNSSLAPDLLNLLNLPRYSPSSVHPKIQNYHNTLFGGDVACTLDNNGLNNMNNFSYDPILPLNLPHHHPPLFRDLFQSIPQYEREGDGSGLYGDHETMRNFDSGVLEFATDMKCFGKKGKKGKPFATEKHRREQLNGKFQDLKKLVPFSSKPDRASIVGDAIKYIQELLREVSDLKILVEKKRCTIEKNKRHKHNEEQEGDVEIRNIIKPKADESLSYNNNNNGSGTSSLRSSWIQRKSKETEVDVRIIDDDVTIKLAQKKKINCLLVVSKVLDELQLDIHHVAGGLVGDNFSFLFNTKICEGSCVYASAIANKLIEVVDRQYAAILPTSSF